MSHVISNKLQAIADNATQTSRFTSIGEVESLHDYYSGAFHDANCFLQILILNIASNNLEELDTKETFEKISTLMMLVNDYQELANMIDGNLNLKDKKLAQGNK